MKYFALFLVAVVVIIGLNFVLPDTDKSKLPELKISAYVFCDDTITDPNERSTNELYYFEELEIGKTHLLAPIVGAGSHNLSFRFEFDGGIVEMVSSDMDVGLSVSDEEEPWREDISFFSSRFAYSHRVASGGYISATPVGAGGGTPMVHDKDISGVGYTGREYFLTVNAYEFSDEAHPVITATVKLTQLCDDDPNRLMNGVSLFFSVELVSVEYGDKYQMILDSQD